MPQKHTHKLTRMSIDVTQKDHKRIKVLAAAEGVSLKDFVVECIHDKINPQKSSNEKTPNATTRKAMKDAEKGKTFHAKDLADLYKQLGI